MPPPLNWGSPDWKLKLFRELMGSAVVPAHLGPMEAFAGSRMAVVSPLLGYSAYTTSQSRKYASYSFFIAHCDGLMARVRERSIECLPGMIHPIGPMEPLQELALAEHPSYDCLILSPDLVQASAPALSEYLATKTQELGFCAPPDPSLDFYLREFRHETSPASRTPTQVVQALENLLLEKLRRSFLERREPPAPPRRLEIEGILAFIDSHLLSDLNIEQLARKAGMSRRTFFEQFRKATQASPGEYIQAKRLLRARRLLEQEPRRPLSDIAFASGFTSQAYFNRVWRRAYGEPPGILRVRLQHGDTRELPGTDKNQE